MKSKQKEENPATGNFIFGKEIINNGKIISSGRRPVNVIQTDKYSGKGKIVTKQSKNPEAKDYQSLVFQFILWIISGLIVGYLIFTFGWK